MAKLYFYYSAMNAGKTTLLLQSAHNYAERGMRTLILTPRLDDRYGVGRVQSRIGLRAEARAFERAADLYQLCEADIAANGALHCVLVDEAQLAWADTLTEVKTICHTGRKATMVVRVDENGRAVTEGPQVEIGGNDRYVSVTRAEFKRIMAGEASIEPQQAQLAL